MLHRKNGKYLGCPENFVRLRYREDYTIIFQHDDLSLRVHFGYFLTNFDIL